MKHRRRLRIGCAVGADAVTAVVVGRRRAATTTVDVEMSDAPRVERIAAAFEQVLHRVVDSTSPGRRQRVIVRVSLLPPLAQVRRISFPRMGTDDMERVLTRDAAAYFLDAREPHIAAAHRLPGRGAAGQVIAAAAASELIESLCAKAPPETEIDAFVPAAAAWAAAARNSGRVTESINVAGLETILTVERRRLVDVRHRISSGAAGAVDSTASTQHAALSAASGVWSVRAPLLRTPEQRTRVRRAVTRGRQLVAGTLGVLVAAGALHTHASVQRTVTSVRDERASMRPVLEPAFAARDSLLRVEDRLRSARLLASGTPWTDMLTALAGHLPTDAHVVQLTGSADSVLLRIEAVNAAEVVSALRSARVFESLRIVGAVERDASDPDAVTDRFDVSARIRSLREANR